MYTEYTQPQLTFLALHSWSTQSRKLMHISLDVFKHISLISESGEVTCVTKVCEKKVCSVGYKVEIVPGSPDTCCPLQECIPVSLPYSGQCAEPTQPSCGEDQELKRIIGTDGCSSYVCGEIKLFFGLFHERTFVQ